MNNDSGSKSFKASLDSLEPIRNFVTEKSQQAGLNAKQIYGLCLAVDEIATNIILYGYQRSGIYDGIINILSIVEKDTLCFIMEDNATPFNPLEANTPDENELGLPLEERKIGGLGIMLAKQSVDEFKYEFVDGKNHNVFCVKILKN